MKRILAAVLTLCLLAFGAPALAEYEIEGMTPLAGSTGGKRRNLQLAAEQLNGTVLTYGQTFSFNDTVGPRTRERGFLNAPDAQGRRVLGGGMAQMVTTLYLAVRDCGYITLDEYHRYGDKFDDTYVDDGDDAMQIDYDKDLDFEFTSWYVGTIYISSWMDGDYLYVDLDFYEDDWTWNGGGQDMISRASTPLYGSWEKRMNIQKASEAVYWVNMEWGDEFSFNETIGPRTKAAGYRDALNGRGAEVTGGGVAQVATTIYLAVKDLDCVTVAPVKTYGERFVDGYVDDPEDAIITDYKAGTDFSFTYWGDGSLGVTVYEADDELICEVYEYFNE